MNPFKALIYSLTVFFAATPALFARLGETFEECVTRYGKGTELSLDHYRFTKNNIEIEVHLKDGKGVSISYTKTVSLTEAQIQQLLAVNAPGKKWKRANIGANNRFVVAPKDFESSDGELVAHITISSPSRRMTLLILTKAAEDKNKQEAEAATQKAIADSLVVELKEVEGL